MAGMKNVLVRFAKDIVESIERVKEGKSKHAWQIAWGYANEIKVLELVAARAGMPGTEKEIKKFYDRAKTLIDDISANERAEIEQIIAEAKADLASRT